MRRPSRLVPVALVLAAGLGFGLVPGLGLPAASAAARVIVTNPSGDAVVDPTYTTTLTLRGRGFQSIKNGHGGIYVLFGVVKGAWKPSAGGGSGKNYLTVPDSQSKNNAGYAKFVAFPGGDTAGSANGGTIAADGTWTTKIAVPGGTFTTYDNQMRAVEVDCQVSTCGVLTIGAHGVVNPDNETFTRVRVGKVVGAEQSSTTRGTSTSTGTPAAGSTGSTGGTGTTGAAGAATSPGVIATTAPVIATAPELTVDRASAKPGRVLTFSAVGLPPGRQVSATFEDGEAAVGPMTVGAGGQVAGVLRLPNVLATGTYELRIVGVQDAPAVKFAVVADAPDASGSSNQMPLAFAVVGGAALLAALVAAALIRRKRARRA
ncbi:MAG: hypothetical protein JWQ74_181 [Marmoricola sp.]|nr:hypothetical protein [Marmoricola sp.]